MPRIHVSPEAYNALESGLRGHESLDASQKAGLFDQLFPPHMGPPIQAHRECFWPEAETRRQCLSSWVAPRRKSGPFQISNTPLTKASTNLAGHLERLFHSNGLIRAANSHIVVKKDDERTRGVLMNVLNEALVQETVDEAHTDRATLEALCDWNTTVRESHTAWGSEELGYEAELDGALRIGLTKAVNHFINDAGNFKSDKAPDRRAWSNPQIDVGVGVTDRQLRTETHLVLALQEIKREDVAPNTQMQGIVSAADGLGVIAPDGTVSKGFTLTIEGKKVKLQVDGELEMSGEVVLQIWAQAHANKCRWIILHNTNDSLVFYLSDRMTLLVSNLIPGAPRGSSGTLPSFTLASAMVALALVPDTSLTDGELGFYIDTKTELAEFRRQARAEQANRVAASKKRKHADFTGPEFDNKPDDDGGGGPSEGGGGGPGGPSGTSGQDSSADAGGSAQNGSGAGGSIGTGAGPVDMSGSLGHAAEGGSRSKGIILEEPITTIGLNQSASSPTSPGPVPLFDGSLSSHGIGDSGLRYIHAMAYLSRSREHLNLSKQKFVPATPIVEQKIVVFPDHGLDPPPGSLCLYLGPNLGHGHLWDVFTGFLLLPSMHTPPSHHVVLPNNSSPASVASISSAPSLSHSVSTLRSPTASPNWHERTYGRPIPVVIKLVHPSTLTDLSPGLGESDSIDGALNEAYLYSNQLRPLWGRSVPRFYGMWRTDNGLYMMVLEKLGDPVVLPKSLSTVASLSEIPEQDRIRVLLLYRCLHEAGVVHGDLEVRHIRKRIDDKGREELALIDFDAASAAIPNGAEIKAERKQLASSLCVSAWWSGWQVQGPAW